MYVGESKTIKITTSDSVGKLNISSSNGGVATVSDGSLFIDTVGASKSFKITAKSIGSTTVTVVGSSNYAAYSEEKSLQGMTKTIKVNVVERPVDNRSKNNNLKSISVEGYQLEKVNNNNYTLNVSNSVTSVKIIAVAEDSKASVSGTGVYDLKVGENKITVTVTAENGSKNTIIVKITRKDGYYLEDLDKLLKEGNNNIDIVLKSDSKVTKENINSIKNSGKVVNLNYYDSNKKLIYGFIVDGNALKESVEMLTSVENSPSDEKIYEKINYADGVFVRLINGEVPNGIKLRVNVSDKYKEGDKVNIYGYQNNKLTLLGNGISVRNGYVEINLKDGMEYVVTKANLNLVGSGISGLNIYIIISVVEFLVIMILLFIKKRGNKGEKVIYSGKLEKLFTIEENIFTSI
jgi:hypothetical protein